MTFNIYLLIYNKYILNNVYVCVTNINAMKKIKISTKAVSYIVGTCFVLFAVFIYLMVQVDTSGNYPSSSYHIDKLPPIDPVVSDSLPHFEYRRLQKEVEYSRKMKEGMLFSWGSNAWFTGFKVNNRCDTCLTMSSLSGAGGVKEYLVMLRWWKLDTGTHHEPRVYFVKNGQSLLRKTNCKLIGTDDQQHSRYDCSQVDVPVSFRYDKKEAGILIPVSKQVLDVFKPVFIIFLGGATMVSLYYTITAFLQVLMDIRNGDPFSVGNVKRLKFLTIFCFAAPTLLFLLNLLMRVVFYRYFTEDIKLSAEAWQIFWKPFALGLIFAALYSAFKRGKQLKEEQDLTI